MLRKFALLLLFTIFSIPLALAIGHSDIKKSEEILNFVSNIVVNKDSSLDVREKITAYAGKIQIQHGIVRWLPRKYIDNYGYTHRPHYEIREVLVNNQPAPFRLEKSLHQLAVYIGDPSVLLPSGVYIYTIKYHVENAVTFLKDNDALFWNVTGNDWNFPIVFATAEIELPAKTKITNYAGYTGMLNTKENHFSVVATDDNRMVFKTTRALNPGEGLTALIAWPKGFVVKPTIIEQVKRNPQALTAIGIYALAVILFVFLCYRVVLYWRQRKSSR